jgi:hypothetical protein
MAKRSRAKRAAQAPKLTAAQIEEFFSAAAPWNDEPAACSIVLSWEQVLMARAAVGAYVDKERRELELLAKAAQETPRNTQSHLEAGRRHNLQLRVVASWCALEQRFTL